LAEALESFKRLIYRSAILSFAFPLKPSVYKAFRND